MTKLMNRMLVTASVLGTLAITAPASAQADRVATIDAPDAIFNVRAIQTAMQQIETKYAAQITSATNRRTALQTQTKPLFDALDTNRDGNLDQNEQQAAVQAQKPQVKQIRDAETAAATEINTTLRPVNLARIYVFDQLQQRYNASLDGQIRTKQIGLVVPTSAAIRQAPGTDLTAIVRTEIDKPLAIDPPAGWQPTQAAAELLDAYGQALSQAQQRAAAAQSAQPQQPAAAAPRPATPAAKEPGR